MAYTNQQKKRHIYELQTYLYAISLFNDAIPSVTPDGVYDAETSAAVRAFQREYGLSQTGSADPATWNKIVNVYRAYQHSAPEPYGAFPSAGFVAGKGDRGELVYIIQAMLNGLSDKYDNFPETDVCGRYDPQTIESVKAFQSKVGLPVTGKVDSGTWNMLVHCCEHANHTLKRL